MPSTDSLVSESRPCVIAQVILEVLLVENEEMGSVQGCNLGLYSGVLSELWF